MAKAIPNPEPSPDPNLPSWNSPDLLQSGDTPSLLNSYDTSLQPMTTGGANDELAGQLQAENEELRSIIAELQQELEAAGGRREQETDTRLKEYEAMLDEKTELIRSLHLKIQEMEGQIRPPTPKEEELLAMSEELERERCQIQQERRKLEEDMRQLKEDEQVMTEEMRKMEIQMAKERADLARQRNDLQRISDEIRHELERVERDRGLSDRLVQLRQRHVDTMKGKPGGSGPMPKAGGPPPAPTQMSIDIDSEQQQQPPPKGKEEPKRDSGRFRRFFGGK